MPTVGALVLGAADGAAVGVIVGAAVGFAVGTLVGAQVGLAVGLTVAPPSTRVKGVVIFTVDSDLAHPAMMVTTPEPATGMVRVAGPSANLLAPVHFPFTKAALVTSKTYSQLVLARLTTRVSPGVYWAPEVRV
jgi:hypothetical protein